MTRPAVLTIAGSDSGGGAGIQADLKTFAAFGVHGASALAAITAQNSRAVTAVLTLPAGIVEAQIDAVMSDLQPRVVKIGMLGSAALVRLVAMKLEEWKPQQVVLDPVMIASSGARLLEEDAIEAMRETLLPLSTVVTPNWPEAGALIGAEPRGLEDRRRIALSLQRAGVRNLLLKGGHLPGDVVVDTLFEGDEATEFTHPRIAGAVGHGTGCALASAVASGLALGRTLQSACRDAVEFVYHALERRYATGSSRPLYLDLVPELAART
ncbi:MAG TPA: bifunctional hydroxymethylpyrimidine kinase/phosphomethylpyrimidine kinase [Thermoanaerobaculia bacterium]|nr:bifunctional hydroxymethylpyrimidine kinase/phosphomethylpyrimidine kinase [Thermoanaerobaculia bacterium]